MSEKFTLMAAEKANHAIEFMARLLGVSRAGYYAWLKRGGTTPTPGPRARRRAEVAEAVKASHEASRGVNGHRRVRADLTAEGTAASEWLVRRAMREQGLFGVQPRSKKRTTIPAADAEVRPDLLKGVSNGLCKGSVLRKDHDDRHDVRCDGRDHWDRRERHAHSLAAEPAG